MDTFLLGASIEEKQKQKTFQVGKRRDAILQLAAPVSNPRKGFAKALLTTASLPEKGYSFCSINIQ